MSSSENQVNSPTGLDDGDEASDCQICWSTAGDATRCSNGHLLCQQCVNLISISDCPLCRADGLSATASASGADRKQQHDTAAAASESLSSSSDALQVPPSGETGRQPIGSDNSDDAVSDSQPSADATGRKRKAEDDSDLDSPPLKRAAVTSSEATSSAGTSSTVTAEASDQTPINLTNDVGGDRANGECHCQNERNCTICNCVSADQASGGSDDDLTNGSSGHQDDDDATTAEGNTDDASYVDSEEHDAEWDDAENDDNEWNGDDHDSEADGEDRCIDCGEVLSGMDRLAVPPSYRCSKCQSIREKTSRK